MSPAPQALFSDDPAHAALRDAAAALDLASTHHQPMVMSLALAHLARCYVALPALGPAVACYQQALRWARATGAMDHLADLLCELCDTSASLAHALDEQRPGSGHPARERARELAFEASALASRVADPGWEVKLLLRISDIHDRCGDHDDAVLLQTRALRLMGGPSKGQPADPCLLPSLGRLADC
jgi:tetratricopeptide (TPR) repeat protein